MNQQVQVYQQFSREQIDIIHKTVAAKTTPDEFRLFIEVCKHRHLNPLNREIYAISRWDNEAKGYRMTIQVSIDGLRILAERSKKYVGQLAPQWCGTDGQWVDVWLLDTPPAAARIGVLRSDFKETVYAVAKYTSYVQLTKDGQPTAMWKKMPDVLLSKCAESLALRKAFPETMAGIYTHEEMEQADHEERDLPAGVIDATAVPIETTTDVTEQQLSSIRKLCERLGKPVPTDPLSFTAAKDLISALTQEYRTMKAQPAQEEAASPADTPASKEEINMLYKKGAGAGCYESGAVAFAAWAGEKLERSIPVTKLYTSLSADDLFRLDLAIAEHIVAQKRKSAPASEQGAA